jgi:hypothetical protein
VSLTGQPATNDDNEASESGSQNGNDEASDAETILALNLIQPRENTNTLRQGKSLDVSLVIRLRAKTATTDRQNGPLGVFPARLRSISENF